MTKKVIEKARNKTGGPLYQQIAAALRDEIVSGVYSVGSLLPTEESLCQRFSVSRYTIREALRRLREDGLVESRQGAGTVVIPPLTGGADTHQVMSINDLVNFARDAPLEVVSLKTVKIDKGLSDHTGLPVGESWVQILGYRRTEKSSVPVCRTEYYIHRDYAAVGRLLQRYNGPVFSLIEDVFGHSLIEVKQQISAVLISPQLADALQTEQGSPALEVRRTYKTSADKIAQLTINIHPASRFQHSMTMRRVRF